MSLTTPKKILPCLDIRGGKVVVGVQFEDVKDVSDPLELAIRYDQQGADTLILYDIAASVEGRGFFPDLVKEIRKNTSLPLMIGGGIASLEDIQQVMDLGARQVSINTGALKHPKLLGDAVREFGSDAVVLSIDVKLVGQEYYVFSSAGRVNTGMDAIAWAQKAASDGVGALVLNSIATDGVQSGFDITLLQDFAEQVDIPLIASGGAGTMEHFSDVFSAVPSVSGGLAASVFHFEQIEIPTLKEYLRQQGIAVTQ